jgi:catechol 2,3-dioxygenase-like lactoylglutathione lyase family enzyme
MHLNSVVMNVEDLDRSVDFYRDVFGFTELSKKGELAAVYAPGEANPQVIVFRSLGSTAGRRVSGGRHIGIRALVIEVDSVEEVERIAAALDKRGSLLSRHGDDDSKWTAAFGRDPDQIAIVAGASLTPEPIELEAWAALDDTLYGVGE